MLQFSKRKSGASFNILAKLNNKKLSDYTNANSYVINNNKKSVAFSSQGSHTGQLDFCN